MVFVDQEKVVKIAADFPRRVHRGEDIEFRAVGESREGAREHARLDAGRHVQLGVDALFFRGDRPDVVLVPGQVFFHVRHHMAQVFQLVAGCDVQG